MNENDSDKYACECYCQLEIFEDSNANRCCFHFPTGYLIEFQIGVTDSSIKYSEYFNKTMGHNTLPLSNSSYDIRLLSDILAQENVSLLCFFLSKRNETK